MPLNEDGRCTVTDLLPDQCACKEHRNSGGIQPQQYTINAYTDAVSTGPCALNEDHYINVGDRIGLATEKGEPGEVKQAVGWVCNRCMREIKDANK